MTRDAGFIPPGLRKSAPTAGWKIWMGRAVQTERLRGGLGRKEGGSGFALFLCVHVEHVYHGGEFLGI